jgi:hypothetical protein
LRPSLFGLSCELIRVIDAVFVFGGRCEHGGERVRARVETGGQAARGGERVVEDADERLIALSERPGGLKDR